MEEMKTNDTYMAICSKQSIIMELSYIISVIAMFVCLCVLRNLLHYVILWLVWFIACKQNGKNIKASFFWFEKTDYIESNMCWLLYLRSFYYHQLFKLNLSFKFHLGKLAIVMLSVIALADKLTETKLLTWPYISVHQSLFKFLTIYFMNHCNHATLVYYPIILKWPLNYDEGLRHYILINIKLDTWLVQFNTYILVRFIVSKQNVKNKKSSFFWLKIWLYWIRLCVGYNLAGVILLLSVT